MNITTNTTTPFSVKWPGGRGRFLVEGTFDSATVTLAVRNDTSLVYTAVNSNVALTAAGNGYFSLEAGATIAVITSGGGGSLDVNAYVNALQEENSTEERVSVLEDTVDAELPVDTSSLQTAIDALEGSAGTPPIDWDESSDQLLIGGGTTATTTKPVISIGYDASATGDYATAIGNSAHATSGYAYTAAQATGKSAVAIGTGAQYYDGANAAGAYSVAIGKGATANNAAGIAIGHKAVASNTGNITFGVAAVSGTYGVRIGGTYYVATSSGQDAITIGAGARVTGARGIAIGYGSYNYWPTEATAVDAIAIGANVSYGTRARAVRAIVIGSGATCGTAATESMTIGAFAKTTIANSLEIGRWSSSTVRDFAMRGGGGMFAFSIENQASAPTDGGATLGSEAAGNLPREMFCVRRNGDALHIDINVAGTVKSLSLGTAT